MHPHMTPRSPRSRPPSHTCSTTLCRGRRGEATRSCCGSPRTLRGAPSTTWRPCSPPRLPSTVGRRPNCRAPTITNL
ncbi:unnamed protein product [Leptidea sinapis]|uniref:Uncharacterized protein n=1 Tax=Leptidea sinapis TaxID=189913 RepID=A0A5E4Q9D2_9NEOP|nr:unnamed protein product [Leptidea sinapis]